MRELTKREEGRGRKEGTGGAAATECGNWGDRLRFLLFICNEDIDDNSDDRGLS